MHSRPRLRHEQGSDRKSRAQTLAAECVRFKNVEKPVSARLVEHPAAFLYFLFMRKLAGQTRIYMSARVPYGQHASRRDIAMSAHLLAGLDFPSALPTATGPYFLLGLNSRGVWVIRETTGRCAGLFRTREAAIKYAREQSLNGNFTILHQPEGLELDSPQLSEAA